MHSRAVTVRPGKWRLHAGFYDLLIARRGTTGTPLDERLEPDEARRALAWALRDRRSDTAVALAAVEKLVRAKTIAPDERVVVVSTAHGLKFTEFKRAYHEGSLEGVTSRHANRPIELPADVDAVRRAIDARLGG